MRRVGGIPGERVSACPDDQVHALDLRGVVNDVGDEAGLAEHLLREQGLFGVGYAAAVRVGADDEQLLEPWDGDKPGTAIAGAFEGVVATL
ncbi:hypothetical protein ACFFHJ_00705 [Planotetraspora thailandica]|nr:hypothetical protein [Planotetraspora thailandica]